MKKRGFKQIDRVRFAKVKKLAEVLGASQISQVTGIGRGTVTRVMKARDFKDYKENLLSYYRNHKKATMPKNAHVAPVEGQEPKDAISTAVTRRLDRVIELLEEIKNKRIKLF